MDRAKMGHPSRGQQGEAGILTVFTGGHTGLELGHGSAEEQLAKRLPELDRVFPGSSRAYLPGSVVRMHWPSVEHTHRSYACYLPGQASFSGLERATRGQPTFLWGAHLRRLSGLHERGAESGERVAAELSEIALWRSQARVKPA